MYEPTDYSHEPSLLEGDCGPPVAQQSVQNLSERSGALSVWQKQSAQSLPTSGTLRQTPAGAKLAESQSWLGLVSGVL